MKAISIIMTMTLLVISVGWIVCIVYTIAAGIIDGNPLVVVVSGYALAGAVAGAVGVVCSMAIIKRARHGAQKG